MTHRQIGLVGILALFYVGCADAPSDNSSIQTAGEPVTISWTAKSPTTGVVELQKTTITQAQVDWLKASRARAREGFLAGRTVALEQPPAGIETKTSAQTIGSTSWTDCASYNWFFVTSASNGGGNIFCAEWASGANNTVSIGFVPAYYDSATSATGIVFNVCTSTTNCQLTQCCENGSCSGVWRSFFQNSGTGNISPPSGATFIGAQSGIYIC